MVSTIKSFIQYFRTYPLRGTLTLLTIAIGVGALTITFSLSFDVNDAMEESLSEDGRRVVIANAELGEDGEIMRQFPPDFDSGVADVLAAEYENLRDITMVGEGRWNRISANGTSYQLRSSMTAGPTYADLMDLDVVAGSFFTQEDVDSRRQVVVLSESTARIIFGGASQAVGQQVQAAVPSFGGGRFRTGQEPYTVVGVFSDVSELQRDAFGVADVILPLGANLPARFDIGFDPSTVVMARVVRDSIDTAASRIAVILDAEYGDDVLLSVWEGSPYGPDLLIEESRRSVRSFALTVNVLGAVVLVASSIGIFSIMLVEVLSRMREIGLRRALGATRASIRRYFMAHALYFSFAGSAIGAALSFIFYRIVGSSLLPFFETSGLAASDLNLTAPGLVPIALATGAALIVGALFGFLPAVSASRTPIVECIREEAA